MKNNSPKTTMSYEAEADILRIEANKKPIEYANEIGNVVVHFSRDNMPVYFEILEATKFFKQAANLLQPVKRNLAPIK